MTAKNKQDPVVDKKPEELDLTKNISTDPVTEKTGDEQSTEKVSAPMSIDLGNGVSIEVSAKQNLGEGETELSPEELQKAIQAEADVGALFTKAVEGNDARVAFEESILQMTNDELNEQFAFTMPEAVGILREAIANSKSLHQDKMNDLLDKIERTSKL